MYILGISAFYHDSAACILKEDELMAAAQEERFTRLKNDAAFPINAIKYCLAYCKIKLSQVDYIVFYEKPFLKFERLLETYLAFAPSGLKSYLKAIPLWIKGKLFIKKAILKELGLIDPVWKYDKEKLLFTEHHHSHAASAFFPSPYKEAIILTMDGIGEWTTTSVSKGLNNEIQILKEIRFPHSVGLLYSAFTYYLGFKVNSDEYKVMGLAPYGKPVYVEVILNNLIEVKSDGSFKMNMKYFNYCTGLSMTNKRFHQLFKANPRKSSDEITSFHMDIACSVQKVTEDIVLKIADHLYQVYNIKNLCLAGGVALNCVVNGRLLRETKFENIWVQPAAGDAGGALGAAYAVYYQYLNLKRDKKPIESDTMKNALLGPSYTMAEVKAELHERNIVYHEYNDNHFFEELAELIAKGNVIGWFNGRMEFGPRALGSRSILGDPRNQKMQSIINQKIKFRESFRPFAPAVLEEYAEDYFDLKKVSSYMLFTAPVSLKQQADKHQKEQNLHGFEKLKAIKSTIPATTHVDNSARVQTVNQSNPDFYNLIKYFYKHTGCPVLINTSFNIMNEPIVCTPKDAIKCFLKSGLDILAFKNIIIYKSEVLDKIKTGVLSEPENKFCN